MTVTVTFDSYCFVYGGTEWFLREYPRFIKWTVISAVLGLPVGDHGYVTVQWTEFNWTWLLCLQATNKTKFPFLMMGQTVILSDSEKHIFKIA